MEILRNTFVEAINDLRALIFTKADKKTTINNKSLSSNIVLTKYDIGLGNVDNVSDIDKPISTRIQQMLDNKIETININGIDVSGINANIILSKNDIGLGNVDNVSDNNKPISTAVQQALDSLLQTQNTTKVDVSRTINGYDLSNDIILSKNDIGLGNVNNTSDIDKPVSIATQVQLDVLGTTLNSTMTTLQNMSSTLNSSVPVTRSVNGHSLTSDVTVTKSDIPGIENVDNTTDMDKPVSTATEVELNIIREMNMLALEPFIRPVFDSLTMLQFNEVTVYGSPTQPSSWYYNSQLYTRLAFADGNFGMVYLPDTAVYQKYTFIYFINVASWPLTIPKERSDQVNDIQIPNNKVALYVNDKVRWRYIGSFDYNI